MSKIKKYIDQEKSISKFKISVLKKINKTYKKRMLDKEIRFVEFDFSLCNFKNLNEARDALDLFRSSEKDFYTKYSFEKNTKIEVDYLKIINYLKEKKAKLFATSFLT